MGCGSRFWVSWARVLGRSLVEFGWWVEFGSAFYSLVCWLVDFFFFFPLLLRFLDLEFVEGFSGCVFFFFKVALVDVGLYR